MRNGEKKGASDEIVLEVRVVYNSKMVSTRLRWLISSVTGVILIAGLFIAIRSPQNLLGRVLEGDELFRVQAESDFDRDGDIDFLDFTVFSAYYEEM